MFALRVVQAAFGDCLIVEYGSASAPKYILIDGGPGPVYERYLKPELQKISGSGGKLEALVVSHIDNDHVAGLIGLTADLRATTAPFITIDRLWHNSFSRTVDRSGTIGRRLQSLSVSALRSMAATDAALFGVKEGNKLRIDAQLLGIPINGGFPNDFISVDTSPQSIAFDDLTVTIVGPTEENLENLRKEWEEWLDKHENAITDADPLTLAKADASVPNLSSVMLLARAADKTMLLTGDGRGDHLIDGLRARKLLNNGSLHVDLLKLPHHGSDANVTRDFFDTITADIYVASANGRYGNPDLATLIWIVEAAKAQQRRIQIFVTNETPATKALRRDYPDTKYSYKLKVMADSATSELIALA